MANSIRMRAQAKGDTTTVKALITHPMETGTRKDKKTGKVVPAHYIKEVVCKHNGKDVVTAQWGPAVSKNPYLSFQIAGAKAGDSVDVTWTDNTGGTDTASVKVK